MIIENLIYLLKIIKERFLVDLVIESHFQYLIMMKRLLDLVEEQSAIQKLNTLTLKKASYLKKVIYYLDLNKILIL